MKRDGPAKLHAALSAPARVSLLKLLRESQEPVGVVELAQACRLHPNTVRFHLDALARAGLVAAEARSSGARGRPRVLYRALQVPSDPGSGYALLASLLAAGWGAAGQGNRRETAEHAGRAAAQRLLAPPDPDRQRPSVTEPVSGSGAEAGAAGSPPSRPPGFGHLLDLLVELGFAPHLLPAARPTSVQVGDQLHLQLHACPFVEVASEHPDVVCALHLGLLRGAVEQLGVPATVEDLHPFIEPGVCLARMTRLHKPTRGRRR
ncbi:helix-turn-helix domain-containing protein [Pseudonocardia sp. NPDC049154]|uniref:helix-turn-helix transcriptional regulator n=1 Tax=Pseudonocardia sp. NPDC049154 TaxID=3155501 RepID=UPI0033D65AE6